MKVQDIIKAYVRIRSIDNTIPDDVLDFMKDSAIEKLKKTKDMNELSKKRIINNIDEFRNFIDDYSNEILSNILGESDGWNQKITQIEKILNDNNIEVSDDVYNDEETEEIINGI